MERETLQVSLHTSEVLYVSGLCDMADVKPIIHSTHSRCSMSRSISGVAAISRLRSSGKTCGRNGRNIVLNISPWRWLGDLGGQRRSAWTPAPFAAIFNRPAPLAATDVTKRPRQVKIIREYLLLYICRMLKYFPLYKCTDFMKCFTEL
jgi:hypothetical protein